MRSVYAATTDPDRPLDGIVVGDQPEPTGPEGSATVSVIAAGLNYHDLWTLRGISPREVRPPVILGTEAVGIRDDGVRVLLHPVINDPDRVDPENLDPSRHTPSEGRPGTFAERVVVPRRNTVPLPDTISDETAAVLGVAWLTAYRMLFTLAELTPGDTVLIQGGAGGVGSAATQLARAAGLRVIATARTPAKRRWLAELGAAAQAPGITLDEPAHAVLDTVGAATWAHSLASVHDGGTIVVCGATTGDAPSAQLRTLIRRQITVRGSYAGTLAETLALVRFVADRHLTPHIHQVLPFPHAREALRALEGGDVCGKIVLKGW